MESSTADASVEQSSPPPPLQGERRVELGSGESSAAHPGVQPAPAPAGEEALSEPPIAPAEEVAFTPPPYDEEGLASLLLRRVKRREYTQSKCFAPLFQHLALLPVHQKAGADLRVALMERDRERDCNKELASQLSGIKLEVQGTLGKLADLEGQVARSTETLSELVQVTAEKDGIISLLKEERDGNSTRAIAAEAKAEEMRRERDEITARYLEIKRKEADALNELTLEAQAAAKKQKEKALADAVASNASLFPVDAPSGAGGGAQWSRVPDALGKTLVVHEASINGVMFSPDGGRFFTCSDDKTARVFDAQATRCVMTIRGSTQGVINAVPSATGDTLLLSSNDKSALLYNLTTDKVKHTLTGHTEKILACAFNYDMKTAFTGSHDRTLKQWDADRGYNLRTVICISGVYDMGILSDGVTVISGHHDGKLRRWDSRAKEVAEVGPPVPSQICCTRLSPDLHRLLVASRDNLLRVFDTRMLSHSEATYTSPEFVLPCTWSRACWSPDGQSICAGGSNGNVVVWDRVSTKVVRCLTGHKAPVNAVAWNPMGGKIVSVDKDKTINIWQ